MPRKKYVSADWRRRKSGFFLPPGPADLTCVSTSAVVGAGATSRGRAVAVVDVVAPRVYWTVFFQSFSIDVGKHAIFLDPLDVKIAPEACDGSADVCWAVWMMLSAVRPDEAVLDSIVVFKIKEHEGRQLPHRRLRRLTIRSIHHGENKG